MCIGSLSETTVAKSRFSAIGERVDQPGRLELVLKFIHGRKNKHREGMSISVSAVQYSSNLPVGERSSLLSGLWSQRNLNRHRISIRVTVVQFIHKHGLFWSPNSTP